MGSRSPDLGTELIIHSLTVDCDTFSYEENNAVVFPVISVEVEATGSEAMLALSFFTLLLKCLTEITGKVNTRVNGWQHFMWRVY